jgi:antitoxin component YwqK of YwqJK toxin-antitoxin module
MKNKLIFIFIVLLELNVQAQFNCNDIFYNADTLVTINGYNVDTLDIINDELFSGYCDSFDKHGKIASKTYIGYGVLDSIVYFYKNGAMEAVEPYRKWIVTGTFKSYYKSGTLKQTINFKNDNHFGLWREYYENGNIKYEADFINQYETRDNSHFTWTKKGVKYSHLCIDKGKTKHIGKLTINSGYSKCKKTKIKNAT